MMKLLDFSIKALVALLVINIVGLVGLTAGIHGATQGSANETIGVRLITPADCPQCFNMQGHIAEMRNLGIPVAEPELLEQGTHAGDSLIKKYGLTKLPALVIDKGLSAYSVVADSWTRIGSIDKDGSYLLEGMPPPFYDLEKKEVRGVISPTYLVDSSCTECYDVSVHAQILARLGMTLGNATTVDVSSLEGKALVERYDITTVPTVILSGEAELYPSFAAVWPSVGRSTEDGMHVFTNLAALGLPYENLTSGKLVVPEQQQG